MRTQIQNFDDQLPDLAAQQKFPFATVDNFAQLDKLFSRIKATQGPADDLSSSLGTWKQSLQEFGLQLSSNKERVSKISQAWPDFWMLWRYANQSGNTDSESFFGLISATVSKFVLVGSM